MYRKIVATLDGSKLSECVIPHLKYLARDADIEEVILVRVTEHAAVPRYQTPGFMLPAPTFAPAEQLAARPTFETRAPSELPLSVSKKQIQAEHYLERVAKQIEKGRKKTTVQTRVLVGDPADVIVSFAEKAGADLIIMASHGRSGIGRWAMGSVADRVFRASKVPVLMVKCAPETAVSAPA
jgi:nucleotide-binding universal stress UspA family protein